MNSNQIEITTLRDGKPVQSDHIVVSENGKELRITRNGTIPSGERFESSEVLSRP